MTFVSGLFYIIILVLSKKLVEKFRTRYEYVKCEPCA